MIRRRTFPTIWKVTGFLMPLVILFILAGCREHQENSVTCEDTSSQQTVEESTFSISAAGTSPQKSDYSFRNACFYCVETRELLYAYNTEEKIAPASLTKILTASVACHYITEDTVFVVGSELSLLKPHSSLCLIKKGHRLALKDLLTGLLISSGNDAAYTVAVNVARSLSKEKLSDSEAVARFCTLMNSFSQSLGMENSNFKNPDGWDDPQQYTTISDLLKLTQYALTVSTIKEIISFSEKHVIFKSGENITWKNTNQLLNLSGKHYNKYAIGMKTGTTKNAGNCLIAVFRKNELTYIAIVCGAETSDSRYEAANRLFETYSK